VVQVTDWLEVCVSNNGGSEYRQADRRHTGFHQHAARDWLDVGEWAVGAILILLV